MEDEEAVQSEASASTPVQSPEEFNVQHVEDAIDYFDTNEVIADDPMFSDKYYQQGVNRVKTLQQKSLTNQSTSSSQQQLQQKKMQQIQKSQQSQGIIKDAQINSIENNKIFQESTISKEIGNFPLEQSSSLLFQLPTTTTIPANATNTTAATTATTTTTTMQNGSSVDIKSLYPAFEKDKILKFSELFAIKVKNKKLNPVTKQHSMHSIFYYFHDVHYYCYAYIYS